MIDPVGAPKLGGMVRWQPVESNNDGDRDPVSRRQDVFVGAFVARFTAVAYTLRSTMPFHEDRELLPHRAVEDPGFIGRLAPYGIFALSAGAAGTIDIAQLSHLQVFIVTYVAIALILTFCLLPAWILSEKSKGTVDAMYEHWMLGKAVQHGKQPRWSVIRDVLHWVD